QLAVPRAKVTAVRADGSSFRATLSAVDGSYSFSDLPPGKWSITSHVDGYPNVVASSVQVAANDATRYDIVMKVPEAAAPVVAAATPAAAAATAAPTAAATAAAVAATVPLGLQAPDAGPEVDLQT